MANRTRAEKGELKPAGVSSTGLSSSFEAPRQGLGEETRSAGPVTTYAASPEAQMPLSYKFDCKYFRGYKPCALKKICATCDSYAPLGRKILIVKLGALGDVVRTTPILFAFKRRDPECHITWVTKANAKGLLQRSPRIDRCLAVDDGDVGAVLRLMTEEFDEVHCYDKDDAAIGLASQVKARRRFGFAMNALGHMTPVNQGSLYCFDLGLSDALKFHENEKTYQEVTYECSELPVPQPMDPYDILLKPSDETAVSSVKKELERMAKGASGPVIGLNTGSGRVFLTKQWSEESFLELGRLLQDRLGARILLLGGKDEDERNQRLKGALGTSALYPGCHFSIPEFTCLMKLCHGVVTGDTLGMHLALSQGVPPVILFGSTCHQEIDLYGLGEKIVAKPECAPCYKNQCDLPGDKNMACMRGISPLMVFDALKRILKP